MDYTITSIAPIILLPFFAFVIGAFVVSKSQKLAVGISTAAIIGSFLFSLRVFFDFVFGKYATNYYIHKYFTWFDISSETQEFVVNMGIYFDNMSAVMMLMVTGVGSLIHVFSIFYMKEDKRVGHFFVYMSLFISAMIGLVLSDNLFSLFVFWEIMGFCSYSLIGFYVKAEGAGVASLKAFMTTRMGDVFFLLGILSIWTTIGSVTYVDIYKAIHLGEFNGITALGMPLVTFAGLAIFMGTVGKSAQFPLQVWLPDAMWGPTPCSALIHAATMVSAGVYLSLRIYPLLDAGGLTTIVAYVGAITAFGAATMALVQTDIKAVMAYSTISQLGYMVLGIGVGAWNAAFMHLIAHAIFKAALFLSCGSIIHELHDHHTHSHVQEMTRMGGLRKKMPITFMVMLFCTFAISGVPFFSGFVSKDRILGDALLRATESGTFIPVAILGFSAAFLTAFYMFRMMFLTFFGEPKDKDLYHHTHQEHLSITRNVPLIILATFTLGIFFSGSLTGQGFVKVFPKDHGYEWFQTLIEKPDGKNYLEHKKQLFAFEDVKPELELRHGHYDPNHGMDEHQAHHSHAVHGWGAIMSIIIAFSGIFLSYSVYYKKRFSPDFFVNRVPGYYKALRNKYYFDYFYIDILIQKVLFGLNNLIAFFDMGIYDRYVVDGWEKVNKVCFKIAKRFDDSVIDLGVDFTGFTVKGGSSLLKVVQSGKVQLYFIIAIVVVAGYIATLLYGGI